MAIHACCHHLSYFFLGGGGGEGGTAPLVPLITLYTQVNSGKYQHGEQKSAWCFRDEVGIIGTSDIYFENLTQVKRSDCPWSL